MQDLSQRAKLDPAPPRPPPQQNRHCTTSPAPEALNSISLTKGAGVTLLLALPGHLGFAFCLLFFNLKKKTPLAQAFPLACQATSCRGNARSGLRSRRSPGVEENVRRSCGALQKCRAEPQATAGLDHRRKQPGLLAGEAAKSSSQK